MESAMSLAGSRFLGSYELLSEIGAGGMGNVYHAIHKKLGREAAIKVISPGLANRSGVIARFENEARSIAALNHPKYTADLGLCRAGGIALHCNASDTWIDIAE